MSVMSNSLLQEVYILDRKVELSKRKSASDYIRTLILFGFVYEEDLEEMKAIMDEVWKTIAIICLSEYNYTDNDGERIRLIMENMSAPQAAEKWGISERRIQRLCLENRVEGAIKFSRVWAIPTTTEKPLDGRKRVMLQ